MNLIPILIVFKSAIYKLVSVENSELSDFDGEHFINQVFPRIPEEKWEMLKISPVPNYFIRDIRIVHYKLCLLTFFLILLC